MSKCDGPKYAGKQDECRDRVLARIEELRSNMRRQLNLRKLLLQLNYYRKVSTN